MDQRRLVNMHDGQCIWSAWRVETGRGFLRLTTPHPDYVYSTFCRSSRPISVAQYNTLQQCCVLQCSNLMLIESVPKEPLSFHVVPFDCPRLQYTFQVGL